jgi:hypothetical protein
VGWFVLQVASGVEGARSDPEVQQMLGPLEAEGGGAASAAQQLRVLLGSAAAGAAGGGGGPTAGAMLAVADLQAAAGGRQDNDKADFRDIAIMPTADEVSGRGRLGCRGCLGCQQEHAAARPLLAADTSARASCPGPRTPTPNPHPIPGSQAVCTMPPHLPRRNDNLQLQLPEAALLDRQFRLLREDFVGPLRQELADLGLATAQEQPAAAAPAAPSSRPGSSQQQQQQQQQQLLPGWQSGSSRNVFRQVAVLGACVKPRPCVMVSLALPARHEAAGLSKAKRLAFWTDRGHSTLPLDALVCLELPSGALAFGTVARREVTELSEDEQRPMVRARASAGASVCCCCCCCCCCHVCAAAPVQREESRIAQCGCGGGGCRHTRGCS